jgi:hypothetical protein
VFENSLKREISNETVAMIVELARRFALESSFQTRPRTGIKLADYEEIKKLRRLFCEFNTWGSFLY